MALLAQLVWQYNKDDRLYTGLSLTHGNAQAVTLIAVDPAVDSIGHQPEIHQKPDLGYLQEIRLHVIFPAGRHDDGNLQRAAKAR